MDQGNPWMNPVVLNLRIRQGINAAGEYGRFIGELRHELAHHPLRQNYIDLYGAWLTEHPLLPVQRSIQPPRWIHINLIVQDEDGDEEMRTTIAVRDDNVFFQGFKNKHGQWYEFGINNKKSKRFIAGSTFLGCDVGYPGLVGGCANLVELNLTMYDAIRAVRTLSEYQQVVPADEPTRRDLARIAVMICESARMEPHYSTVIRRWNTNEESRISAVDAKHTTNWSKMSSHLLSMLDPSPQRTSLLAVVHLLFNKIKSQAGQHQQEQALEQGGGGSGQQEESGSSNPQRPETPSLPPASGSGGAQEQLGQTGGKSVRTQPLVQLFSVYPERDFQDVIGTIVVFDGKRGQIIYNKRSQGRNNYGFELALTGPYKAISADGSFAIQAYGILSGTDASEEESSKVIGEMRWDCYADDAEYDKVRSGDIISTGNDGGGRLAMVRYAVWSEAVEVTVEVSLLLPGVTHVHGTITTRYGTLMLFERERDEKVELVPSSADSMVPLELCRPVITVPMQGRYSCVIIYVDLHVATPNKEGDVHLLGTISFYLDKHTGEIRIYQIGNFFVPLGWTRGSNPKGVAPSLGSQGVATSAGPQTSEQQVKVQVNITSPGFHVSPLEPEGRHMGTTPTLYSDTQLHK